MIEKTGLFIAVRSAILAVEFNFSGIKECREQTDIPSKIICGISPTGAIKGNWKLCPEGPYGKILLKALETEKQRGTITLKIDDQMLKKARNIARKKKIFLL